MKCKDCEHCEYVHYDGYNCNRFNAHISEELVDKDLDCMVRDYDFDSKVIFVDGDGCKDIKTSYYPMKTF